MSPCAPAIVNAVREKSHDAPNRLSWLIIVPPDCSFHFQTFSKNASRPNSDLDGSLFFANSRSTTICVAIPA